MDFTKCELGTPVIWDNPDGHLNGVIERIEDDWQPILVRFNGFTLWFTADGRHSPEANEPTLRLVDAVVRKEDASPDQDVDLVTSPLPDLWVQFMCASMAADYSVDYAATKADLALEEYKRRFQ